MSTYQNEDFLIICQIAVLCAKCIVSGHQDRAALSEKYFILYNYVCTKNWNRTLGVNCSIILYVGLNLRVCVTLWGFKRSLGMHFERYLDNCLSKDVKSAQPVVVCQFTNTCFGLLGAFPGVLIDIYTVSVIVHWALKQIDIWIIWKLIETEWRIHASTI